MRWHWIHKYSKWTRKVYVLDNKPVDGQARVCRVCNYEQREFL